MSLNQYFWANKDRPIRKWAHYLPLYERYFRPFVGRRIVFLEIGCGNGGSSQMFKHYFGPTAKLVSVDIRDECRAFEDEQVSVRIGDQGDPAFMQSLIDEFGAPDVVLDDGSHLSPHMIASFEYLYPRMPRDGLYMVEDVHASYWPDWQGGLRKPGAFMERVKETLDELHAHYTNGELPETEIGRNTRGIHVHDSVVVFEKGAFVNRSDQFIPNTEGATRW